MWAENTTLPLVIQYCSSQRVTHWLDVKDRLIQISELLIYPMNFVKCIADASFSYSEIGIGICLGDEFRLCKGQTFLGFNLCLM